MSCGNHHDVQCREILAALDSFLDGEDTPMDRALITQHLDECGPCLQEHHLERLLKARLARAFSGDACSDEVRTRIVTRLRQVRVEGPGASIVSTESSFTAILRTD